MSADEYTFISGAKPNHLYKHEWGNRAGCYLVAIFDDDDRVTEAEIPLSETSSTKTRVRMGFVYNKSELTDIEFATYKKIKNGPWRQEGFTPWDKESFSMKPIDFAKAISFINFVTSLDIPEIQQRRIKLDVDSNPIDEAVQTQIRTVLEKTGGYAVVKKLLDEGVVTDKDLVNLGYRREQARWFERMISDKSSVEDWAKSQNLKDLREESVWQAFFEKNEWIFGFGLDYKFNSILQREAHVGESDYSGKGNPRSDFLLGDNRFTVLVEIKTPSSKIFGPSSHRAGTWQLSSELADSVSQILTQKAAILSTAHRSRFNSEGEPINHEIFDPKTFLIYGHWPNNADDERRDALSMRRTFELYRRNLRNVEIITFDELLERAMFLVRG